MKAAVISERGRKSEMEDAYFLDTNFANQGWVFGEVYDGHNGSFAAEYVAGHLSQVFLRKLNVPLSAEIAFIESYQEVSEQLNHQDSGTTAVTFLIAGKTIYCANVGDARAIVIGEKGVQQLTVDHRIDNPEERERIRKMGGQIRGRHVYREGWWLMPTRTIGDEWFKPVGIIATPFVSNYTVLESDLGLLAACDGLFEVMTNEEIAELSRRFPERKSCVEALKDEVLYSRHGTDNLTMIAVSFRPASAAGSDFQVQSISLKCKAS